MTDLISEITSQSEKIGRDHDNDRELFSATDLGKIHFAYDAIHGGGFAYHAQGGLSEFFQKLRVRHSL